MPRTLLLADDSVTIQRVIELTFADEDIHVVAVSDGDQAIARLEEMTPDIVLADIGMPGKTGYEVAQHMKQSPRLAGVPVLLLTGAFEPVDQVRVAAAGCDGVLAKPFEPALVIDRVRDLLSRPRATGVAATTPPITVASPPPGESPRAAANRPAPAKPIAELDEYFDRLDAAFTDLSAGPDLPKVGPPPPSATSSEVDWFDTTSGPVEDLPLAAEPASPVVSTSVPEATAPPPIVSTSVPVTSETATPRSLPSLADAFAALLAAEHHETMPPVTPVWPASPVPPAPPAPTPISEDLVEEVTRVVLERLSDRVVRDTVAEIVSSIAERLVREEIERIKSSIK